MTLARITADTVASGDEAIAWTAAEQYGPLGIESEPALLIRF